MSNGMVYVVNSENKIVRKFEYDFEEAMSRFHRGKTSDGRYHIMLKDAPVPYEEIASVKYDKIKMPNL